MGVCTHTMADYTSPVGPARLFKAFCIDNHNFMPTALPDFIQSVDVLHNEPSIVGSINQINFREGRSFKYAKNRVDEIDESKYYMKYTTIEGGVIRDTVESVVYEMKFEADDSRTRHTMVVHFHTKGDNVVKDEVIVGGKTFIKTMFNVAQEYLIANPQLYT